LTVISPTISVDYWKSKTKTFLRISSLAMQSSQCEAFFDFKLCTHSVCAYASFVRTFLSCRNPQLQIGADSRLPQPESCSRSDPVGDSLKGTMTNGCLLFC
jgi:hypothetical protein